MSLLLVTNNPKVYQHYHEEVAVLQSDYGYLYPLYAARDAIHTGHRLLTHPLCGSLKPNQTPYKSVLLERTGKALDVSSVELIEQAIAATLKFYDCRSTPLWKEHCLDDFMTIDLSLIQRSLAVSMQQQNG